jgi:hypothetical protein
MRHRLNMLVTGFSLFLSSSGPTDRMIDPEVYVDPSTLYTEDRASAEIAGVIDRALMTNPCVRKLKNPEKFYNYDATAQNEKNDNHVYVDKNQVRVHYIEPNRIVGDGFDYLPPPNVIYFHSAPYRTAFAIYDVKNKKFLILFCNLEIISYHIE